MKQVNVVVIGHKDHGKSTLIGRLLYDCGVLKPDRIKDVEIISRKSGMDGINYAFLLDSFSEERDNGLTMDTVQAGFDSGKIHYNFIDCPGHRELLKNMMTGASIADGALLVVSAAGNEGIDKQTIEHLKVVNALGIKRLVAVVTKMDVAGYSERAYGRIKRGLAGVFRGAGFNAAKVAVVPVSSVAGRNLFSSHPDMAWYGGKCLVETLENVFGPGKKQAAGVLRLPVQDVYGKVVIGKIESGVLETGRKVVFLPSGLSGSVGSIDVNGKTVKRACAGENAGFMVNGMDLKRIKRGEVCCLAGKRLPCSGVNFSARLIVPDKDGLIKSKRYVFKMAAAERKGRFESFSKGSGLVREARVRLGSAAAFEKYTLLPSLGRFSVTFRGKFVAAGIIIRAGGK